jgi:long-chain fatty acid transport protein
LLVRGRQFKLVIGAAAAPQLLATALLCTLLAMTTPLWAGSGFLLRSQSTATLGSAQAGMTAAAEDTSSFIFNPASLTYGSGSEILIGGTGIFTNAHFAPNSAQTVLGTPITGPNGGNAGTQALLPNLYGSVDLTDKLRAGLAVTSLYGLGSRWTDNWIGRYYALTSKLFTIDISPAVALRVNPAISVGVGLDIQYAKAKTSNAIDFGTADQVLFGGANGGVPQADDGKLRVDGSDWGIGFTAGILVEPIAGTRLGASFRSPVSHTLTGDARFSLNGPVGRSIAAVTGAFTDTGSSVDIQMPAAVMFGFYQKIDDAWSIMGDAQWTGWHSLQQLRVKFDNPNQPDGVTQLNWHDSWYAALGVNYRPSDQVTLRFGVAYDQSPVPTSTRTPVIPDSDSYWIALGVEYRPFPGVKLDAAYGHIFTDNAKINLKASDPGSTFRGNLKGTVQNNDVDFFSLQAGLMF